MLPLFFRFISHEGQLPIQKTRDFVSESKHVELDIFLSHIRVVENRVYIFTGINRPTDQF